MVAEAVEKMQKKKKKKKRKKHRERELLYFLFTTDSNIFAQTLHPQVKKSKDISI